MKKTLVTLSACLALGIVGAFGQATIAINNAGNTGVFNGAGGQAFNGTSGNPVYSSLVTSNGLIFTANTAAQAGNLGYTAGSQMLGVDVSFTLLGGASAGTMSQIITVTGAQINTPQDDNLNWGQISFSGTYNVPGSTASSPVFLDLQVWEGNSFSTFAAAQGHVFTGDTGAFLNPSGGGLTPASALTGMPDLQLTLQAVPEPSILALAGLGAAALMTLRRRK